MLNLLQEKFAFLLEKYKVNASAVLSEDGKTVTIDGTVYPVLSQRQERRFVELRKIVESTTGRISHFKIMSIHPRTTAMDDIIARELDTAEYVGHLQITEIFAAAFGNSMNICCATKEGSVITLELSNGLPDGRRVIDKHEIITDRGTACDRVVDSQTPLSSVYVYGDETAEYTDTDFELYGLSDSEVATVRRAFALAQKVASGADELAAAQRIDTLVKAANRSSKTGENIVL